MRTHLVVALVALLLGASDALSFSGPSRRSCSRSSHSSSVRRAAAIIMAKKKGGGGGGSKMVQVVLSEDIKGVGRKNELVSVKPAYADNFIVRGGKGRIADEETLAQIAADDAATKAAAAAALAQAVADDKKLASVFGEEGCVVTKKVGPDGAIFGSVTGAELAAAIKEKAGVAVDKKHISSPDIKFAGSGSCNVELHKTVVHKLKVVVVAA